LAAFGNSDERANGYMIIESPTDLLARLSTTYDTGWYIEDALDEDGETIYLNETPDKENEQLNPLRLNWPNGVDTNFNGTDPGIAKDFYSVLNYLQYGGKCFIAGAPDNLPGTVNNAIETVKNAPNVINLIFTTTAGTENDTIIDIAEKRGDCMAICQVDVKEPLSSNPTPNGLPNGENQSKITFHVAGQKVHFGISSTVTTENDTDSSLKTTGVAADVAGRISSVSASTTPYGSPAGTDSLLGVVKMEYDLTSSDREELAKSYVNQIRTFPEYGTVLFSDMTGNGARNVDDKVFNYANVALTYLHINRLVTSLIRPYMFIENNASNRASLTSTLQTALRRVVAAGGLTSFTVICDETNNPENIVLSNNLICDITLGFVLTIQKITLRFATSGGQSSQSLATSSGSSSSGSSSGSSSSTSSTSSSGGSSY
jgi:hypothetical protein